MEQLTDEQIAYGYKTIHCKIKSSRFFNLTDEDIEDITSYVWQNVISHWKYFDHKKAKWNTFLVLCINHALSEAWEWWYRQHWRTITEPLPDDDILCQEVSDEDVDALLDELVKDPNHREMMRLRYQGFTANEILKILNTNFKEYNQAKKELHEALVKRTRGKRK